MTMDLQSCVPLSARLSIVKRRPHPRSLSSFKNAGARPNAGLLFRLRLHARNWPAFTFNLITRRFTMTSLNPTPNPKADLAQQLLQLGLKATAASIDDFLARATKSH